MADTEKHTQPASPFYRVTLKAIIFDDQNRLLVVQKKKNHYEMPGGGWEHDEDMPTCLKRELFEELGTNNISVGDICFTYRGLNQKGYMALRIAVRVQLHDTKFSHGQDMIASRFVTKGELLRLPMPSDEAPIKEHVSQIWTK